MRISNFVLWRLSLERNYSYNLRKGFSLIELLLVVAMLSILFLVLTGILNPITQVDKARDATKQHDFEQIKQALDTYYNDTGCYPTSIPINNAWTSSTTVYMQKVPQDPNCSGTAKCYLYQTDGSNCPQWNVLYGLLETAKNTNAQTLCPLTNMKNSNGNSCEPKNLISAGYNFCVISGNINCDYLSQNNLPTPSPTPIGGIIPTQIGPPPPTATSTPNPSWTPTPTPNCDHQFSCNGSPARCDIVASGTGQYCTNNCDGNCP